MRKVGKQSENNLVIIEKQIKLMKDIFDEVIIVEPISEKICELKTASISKTEQNCYEKCPLHEDKCGCICKHVVSNKSHNVSRFTVNANDSYFIIGRYIKVYNKELVMIITQQVNTEFTFGTTSVGKEVENISNVSSSLNKDILTNIFNRKYWNDRAGYFITKAESINKEVCLASIDIDNFKRFNDTYGHDVGDLVLKTLADNMKKVTNSMNKTHPIRFG